MIDEAYRAFDLGTPERHYEVLCDFDPPQIPLPFGDGTVGIPTADFVSRNDFEPPALAAAEAEAAILRKKN